MPGRSRLKQSRRRRNERADRLDSPRPVRHKNLKQSFQPAEILSPEEIETVHEYSMRLLDEIGLEFMLPASWGILEENGARVDHETGMVQMDRELVEKWIAKAPSTIEFKARKQSNDLIFGGDHIAYGSAGSTPNAMDAERGHRPGDQASFRELVKISHGLDSCSFFSGYPVEPIDLPANTRHLDCYQDLLTLTDKPFRIYAIGKTRVEDALEMICIGHGINRDELKRAPRTMTNLNVNSPLKVDEPLLEGSMEMVRNGQIVVVTPVAFAGAMSPITLSGSLIQHNAECLAVIAFLQMVAPGSPVLYGSVISNIDMKSGAPAFGTPETVTGLIATGQLARRYGIPMRGFLGSSSNAVDAQAAYETLFCIWANNLAGVHAVFHAHGLLETGLITSYEKAVLDADMISMMSATSRPIDLSDAEEVLQAVKQAGPGGHYLGSDHTLSRYKTEFYSPQLSDWRPYEFWKQDGAPDTAERARKRWHDLLDAYVEPVIDPGIRNALQAYVERRKIEIGTSDV